MNRSLLAVGLPGLTGSRASSSRKQTQPYGRWPKIHRLAFKSRSLGDASYVPKQHPNVAQTPTAGHSAPLPIPIDRQNGTVHTAVDEVDEVTGSLAASAHAEGVAPSNGTDPSLAVNPAPEDPPQGGIPHRWRVVGMMALAFVLCNMDKVNMSVAVIPMAKDLGWSATERGLVSSAFFWGYSLTQVPAGWVSTRLGGAKVLLAGVALWSVGTLVAPPAASFGLMALCLSRLLVGLGEGLAPSSATTLMARLVPERERARAVTTVFGSLDVGSAVGLLTCGPLIRAYGWPSVFYLFAIAGLAWCLAWPLFKPEQQTLNTSPEAVSKVASPATDVPWGEFFRSAPVWAIIVAHFCFNWGYYTLLAWLPSYFELSLGLNVESSSLLTLIPYIAMICMTPFVGPVADGLVSRGWKVTNVRKLAQGIAFAVPALCMIALSVLTPHGAKATSSIFASSGGNLLAAAIIALMSIAFACGSWSRAGLYCNHQDLSPRFAGALLGVTNTAGAFPGILGVTSVGFLLDRTNSWGASLFLPTAACQLFGMIIYSIFASSERQPWA
eukprot:jgi/Botrbrau1/16808/Bobra.150_2s0035.1